MRSPENVLNSLTAHSKLSDYKFERLYRILFNEQMYHAAYRRISANAGEMTKGIFGSTIDQLSLKRIEKLIGALRHESFQPMSSSNTCIARKNGKGCPLGIPAFDDKLVQEVLRMILEAIYEGGFEDNSHGCRPNRSCHTAIRQVSKTFNQAHWFIEGHIQGVFDHINHDVLIGILKERIDDERFIRVIRKFLTAGYTKDGTFRETYSGKPQGGTIGPILANIYLDKLDKYIMEYISPFDQGNERKHNRQRLIYEDERTLAVQKHKAETNLSHRKRIVEQLREIEKRRAVFPSDGHPDRSLRYVRYADTFLIGVAGTLSDCKQIKEDVTKFLCNRLLLELSDEKTRITDSKKAAKFLSFDIQVSKSNRSKRDSNGKWKGPHHQKIVIKVPAGTIKEKLIDYDAVEFTQHNGVEQWKPKCRTYLLHKDDLAILTRYNFEIIGFYNYYSIAQNSATINSFKYIMEYSMYKTFANKYRTTVPNICRKYRRNSVFTVFYKNRNGETKMRCLYHEGFQRSVQAKESVMDN
jgi:group II intron reverse transcriptase/maturase